MSNARVHQLQRKLDQMEIEDRARRMTHETYGAAAKAASDAAYTRIQGQTKETPSVPVARPCGVREG